MSKLHIHLLGRFMIVATMVYSLSVSTLGGVFEVGASAISQDSQTSNNNRGATQLENQVYDDIDPAWTYSGYWSKESTGRAYGGELHASNSVEDQATISITGSQFTLVYSIAPKYGKLDVFVDGLKVQTITQRKAKTAHQKEWVSPELALGTHTLKFVHASGKAVNIDAIKVRGAKANPVSTATTVPPIVGTPTLIPSELPNPTESPFPTAMPSLTASPVPTNTLLAASPTLIPSATASPTLPPTSSPAPSSTPTRNPTVVSSPTATATSIVVPPSATATPTALQATGPAYYASPAGSGTTCSSTAPCSLTSGLNKLVAGDTLYLKSGTYLGALSLTKSNITLATAPGEPSRAILSGDLNGNGSADTGDVNPILLEIRGNSVVVDNVEVAYAGKYGVFISGTGSTIRNSNIHDIRQAGIYMYAPRILVEGNTVWRAADSNYCGGGSARQCNGDWNVGIVVGDSRSTTAPGIASSSIIRGNTVYHNSGEGIGCEHNDYVTIENNIVYDNWALGIYLDQCSFVTIRNNLVYYTSDTNWWRFSNHPANAVSISNENITSYPMGHDRLVYNNLIIGGYSNLNFYLHPNMPNAYLANDLFANNTLIRSQGSASVDMANAPHQNTRFFNNLIYQPTGSVADIGNANGGISFASNLWSQSPPTSLRSPTDIITQNPGLVDPGHSITAGNVSPDWYKLITSSPAINAGTSLSQVTNDFAGAPRSNPPDIGAFENTDSVSSLSP